MKLKQLEYLIKIVECGSITQAAQQLYISQPSLTKAVSNLEDEYKIQLLVRKPRGVELTLEGRDFVHHARGIMAAVHALEADFTDENAPPRARLFVATQQLDFIYDMFLEAYKLNNGNNLYYNLIETERNDVVQQILDGQADIGFSVRTSEDSKNFLWSSEARKLDIHTLDKDIVHVAVGPMSPFWDRESISMDEIDSTMQLALDMEEQAKQIFWADYNYYSCLNNNKIIFMNTASACEYFLLNTDAFSFVSPWTAKCYKDPRIKVIPISEEKYMDELIWIKRAGEPLGPTEAFFLDKVYNHLGKKTPAEISELVP